MAPRGCGAIWQMRQFDPVPQKNEWMKTSQYGPRTDNSNEDIEERVHLRPYRGRQIFGAIVGRLGRLKDALNSIREMNTLLNKDHSFSFR